VKVLKPRLLALLRCLSFFPTLFFKPALSSAVFKQEISHRCNVACTSQGYDFPKRRYIFAHNQIWICTRTEYLLQFLWCPFDGPKAREPYCGLVSIDGRRLRSRARGICFLGEPDSGIVIEVTVRFLISFIVVPIAGVRVVGLASYISIPSATPFSRWAWMIRRSTSACTARSCCVQVS